MIISMIDFTQHGLAINKGDARRALGAMLPSRPLWFDFAGVGVLNARYADEIFKAVYGYRMASGPLFVGLIDVDDAIIDDVMRSLRAVCERNDDKHYAIPIRRNGDIRLHGVLPDSLRAAWTMVRAYGEFTTLQYKQLDQQPYSVATYSTRLNAIYNMSLVVRSEHKGTEGYVYSLPKEE